MLTALAIVALFAPAVSSLPLASPAQGKSNVQAKKDVQRNKKAQRKRPDAVPGFSLRTNSDRKDPPLAPANSGFVPAPSRDGQGDGDKWRQKVMEQANEEEAARLAKYTAKTPDPVEEPQ